MRTKLQESIVSVGENQIKIRLVVLSTKKDALHAFALGISIAISTTTKCSQYSCHADLIFLIIVFKMCLAWFSLNYNNINNVAITRKL